MSLAKNTLTHTLNLLACYQDAQIRRVTLVPSRTNFPRIIINVKLYYVE